MFAQVLYNMYFLSYVNERINPGSKTYARMELLYHVLLLFNMWDLYMLNRKKTKKKKHVGLIYVNYFLISYSDA
jgi:uncharacterized membrane protein